MTLNKKNIAFSIVVLISACTFFLSTCRSKRPVLNVSHYIDTNDTRKVQVEKCGECHQAVFENWKIDPHSNAFLTLEAHDKMLDSSMNFPESYNGYIEQNMEKICASCHTGKNIFETNFAGISHLTSPHLIDPDKFPNAFLQAFTRDLNQKEDLLTGVDCITCHVQGDHVVTNLNSKAPDSIGLIKSHLFSSNQSCFSCHHHQVSTMKELVVKRVIPYEVGCVNCHQEYNSNGKGTHYYYWRNDAPDKIRPDRLNIFECVNLSFLKNDPQKNVIFNWTNTIMPHGFSECGEAKCTVVSVYTDGSEKTELQEYLNRKNFFDTLDMPAHFRAGVNGNEFIYNQPIKHYLFIKNFKQLDYIRIEGWVKPQYWSTEEEFNLVFVKKIPVNF